MSPALRLRLFEPLPELPEELGCDDAIGHAVIDGQVCFEQGAN
jgi:hypothetical protein